MTGGIKVLMKAEKCGRSLLVYVQQGASIMLGMMYFQSRVHFCHGDRCGYQEFQEGQSCR